MYKRLEPTRATGLWWEADPGNYTPSGRLITGQRNGTLVPRDETALSSIRLLATADGQAQYGHPTGMLVVYPSGVVVWCYGCGDKPHAYHYAGAGERDVPRILGEFPVFRPETEADRRAEAEARRAERAEWQRRYSQP